MANLSLAASKSAQLSSQAPSFTPTGPSNTSEGQKRAGGSGTFVAGSSTRAGPSPRNKQAARNQNKQTRRYRQLDEDAYPVESVAMRDTGGRKGQNITHLMNFSLPPRQSQYQQYDSFNRRPVRRTWGMGSGYHAVDKARWVLCRTCRAHTLMISDMFTQITASSSILTRTITRRHLMRTSICIGTTFTRFLPPQSLRIRLALSV